MTTTPIQINRTRTGSTSQAFASEIRGELGRQGLSQRILGERLQRNQTWVSRRISLTADVELTVDEISEMAEALNVPVERLYAAVLPRLDSNQQPSGYGSEQVNQASLLPRLDSNQQPSGYASAQVIDLSEVRASRRLERVS